MGERDSTNRNPTFHCSISRGSSQAHANRAAIFRRTKSLFPLVTALRPAVSSAMFAPGNRAVIRANAAFTSSSWR